MTVSLDCRHTSLPVENGLSWDGVYRLFKMKNWNETNTHTHILKVLSQETTCPWGMLPWQYVNLCFYAIQHCDLIVTQIQMTEFMQHVALTKCYTHIQSPRVTCMCMMCIGRWLQLHCNTSRDLPQPFLLHWTRISWRIRSLWEMRSWHAVNSLLTDTSLRRTPF